MFTWANIVLMVLKIVDSILGTINQDKWIKAGRAEAERDEAQAARSATEAELKAAVEAPKNAEDAIRRFEDGTA